MELYILMIEDQILATSIDSAWPCIRTLAETAGTKPKETIFRSADIYTLSIDAGDEGRVFDSQMAADMSQPPSVESHGLFASADLMWKKDETWYLPLEFENGKPTIFMDAFFVVAIKLNMHPPDIAEIDARLRRLGVYDMGERIKHLQEAIDSDPSITLSLGSIFL